jgi:hypothetical protein
MNFASKMSAGLLAAACLCSLSAAEILSIVEPADFTIPKRVTQEGDSILVKGPSFNLNSAKPLTLEPTKKYKISGEFRLKEGAESGNLYLGFTPFDANGKQITSASVNAKAKSDTVVVKAAAEGDSMICVKDASKWDMKTPYGFIAFNTKPDYSDLPNKDYVAVVQGGIKQNGDIWEITLKAPLTKAIPEGTEVRQQLAGSSNIYAAYKLNNSLNSEWTVLSGVIDGKPAEFGVNKKQLWHGTASVRILICLMGGKKDNVLEMKNIVVEEVE